MQRKCPMRYNVTAKRGQFDIPTKRDTLFMLSATLSDLRKRTGMTQETGTANVLISTQTIRNWEVSRHEPYPTKVRPSPNSERVPRTTSSIQPGTPTRYLSGATAPKCTSPSSRECAETRG